MRIEIKMPEEYKDTEMFYEDGKLNIIDKKWLAEHDKELIAKYISDYLLESYEEHNKQIRAEVSESVLAIANTVIEGVRKEFEGSNDMICLGVMCELQRFRSMIEKQLKENE